MVCEAGIRDTADSRSAREYSRKFTSSIKQSDILRSERNRNAAQWPAIACERPRGFEHVAQQQDHGESEPCARLPPAVRLATSPSSFIPSRPAAPWALCLRDDPMPRPCRQLEAVRDDIERIS